MIATIWSLWSGVEQTHSTNYIHTVFVSIVVAFHDFFTLLREFFFPFHLIDFVSARVLLQLLALIRQCSTDLIRGAQFFVFIQLFVLIFSLFTPTIGLLLLLRRFYGFTFRSLFYLLHVLAVPFVRLCAPHHAERVTIKLRAFKIHVSKYRTNIPRACIWSCMHYACANVCWLWNGIWMSFEPEDAAPFVAE